MCFVDCTFGTHEHKHTDVQRIERTPHAVHTIVNPG